MKTVIQTATFIASARQIGLSEDDTAVMVEAIAIDPSIGDIIVGTGGCRKRRFAASGRGKRGGYRTIHYNGADDVPVLLLVVIDKGERADISQAERNQLRKALATYEEEYRASVAAKVKKLREGA
jgi:hypothetical protein